VKQLVETFFESMTRAGACLVRISELLDAAKAPGFREVEVGGSAITREQAVNVLGVMARDIIIIRQQADVLAHMFGLDHGDWSALANATVDDVQRLSTDLGPTFDSGSIDAAYDDVDALLGSLGLAVADDDDVPEEER